MKAHSTLFTLALVLLSFGLGSCVTQSKMAYFKPLNEAAADTINQQFKAISEPVIRTADQLLITVSALDPDAAAPFNLPTVSYAQPGSDLAYVTATLQSYIVDKDGNIDFPVLGTLPLAGLTKAEAVTLLKSKLEPFLHDPIVNIRFMNWDVTVMGEVNRPGKYAVTDEKVTILDALAMAGDMTVYGKRDNVLLARENNGKLEFARLNLNTEEIFTSPYFYLQQNDVIYVEPNSVRAVNSQNVSLYLSMVTTLGSLSTVVISAISLSK